MNANPFDRFEGSANPFDQFSGPAGDGSTLSAGPKTPPAPLDLNKEAGWVDRLAGALKFTNAGLVNFLKWRHGDENVATDASGAPYIKEGGEWKPFNKPGLSTTDVTNIAVPMATAALPIGGAASLAARGGIAAGFGAAALGGAAGSAVDQAISAALPGSDEASLADRAKALGINAVIGAGTEGAVRGGAAVVDALRPSNVLPRVARRGLTPQIESESRAIERGLGTPLTLGQYTQSAPLLTIEGALRRSPTSASTTIRGVDERQMHAAYDQFQNIVQEISSNPANAEFYGGRVATAFDNTLSAARKIRSRQAAADFGDVDALAGNAKLIVPQNLVNRIDELVQQFDVPGGGDASAGLVSRLKSIRNELTMKQQTPTGQTIEMVRPLKAGETQRLLQIYSSTSSGSGKLFQDIDTGQQRMIAGKFRDALMNDVDAAADSGGVSGDVARALQTARDNYRNNSTAINDLRQSAIGQYLGTKNIASLAPEDIATKVANMRPTQLRATMSFLGTADPELADSTKAFMLQRAFEQALPSSEKLAERYSQGAASTVIQPKDVFSPARLMTELSKSPVDAILTPNERLEMQLVTGSLQRLANRAGTDGSPTGSLIWAKDIVLGLVKSGIRLDPFAAAQTLASAVLPNRIARSLADPAQRRALLTITTTRPSTRAVTQAFATLAATAPVGAAVGPTEVAQDPGLDAALANARTRALQPQGAQ